MSRKTRAVFIALALAVLIASGISFSYIWPRNTTLPQGPPGGTSSQTQPQAYKTVLKVTAYVSDGYWSRDNVTGLPDYTSDVAYSVSNIGNMGAANVMVTVTLNGQLLRNDTIPSLTIYDQRTYYLPISTLYDSKSAIHVQATCEDSADSCTLAVGCDFPRTFTQDPEVLKLYITPIDTSVVNLKNAIVKSKFFLTPDWIAIRDWVGGNIHYEFDNVSHGQEDYWQLPKETLSLRTGDCEDSAILLCSLLRADGVSATDVYVFVGTSQGQGHAWVSFKWFNALGIESWIRLEPTFGGNILEGAFGDLAGTFENRQVYCSFNDLYYKSY